jgi:hypothetical protein
VLADVNVFSCCSWQAIKAGLEAWALHIEVCQCSRHCTLDASPASPVKHTCCDTASNRSFQNALALLRLFAHPSAPAAVHYWSCSPHLARAQQEGEDCRAICRIYCGAGPTAPPRPSAAQRQLQPKLPWLCEPSIRWRGGRGACAHGVC